MSDTEHEAAAAAPKEADEKKAPASAAKPKKEAKPEKAEAKKTPAPKAAAAAAQEGAKSTGRERKQVQHFVVEAKEKEEFVIKEVS